MSNSGEQVKSFSISKYSESVQKLIRSKIPPVWVHGVISQLNIRGKVVYLTLAEFKDDNPQPLATLNLIVFLWDFHALNKKLSLLPNPFQIETELKVSMLLEADYYLPQGRFQPRVLDIDPNYTLGELAQTKQKILEKLIHLKLLDKNKKIPFPRLPLHIGLITADGSAAHHDFESVLLGSPYAFQLFPVFARMQGKDTETTVLEALNQLRTQSVDIVCVIRGGGSKSDLNYFDSEQLCLEIANYPLPVLTGIGHQIDHSLVDMVAWANKITPTDCARFLVQKLDQEYAALFELKHTTLSLWIKNREMAEKNLLNQSQRTRKAPFYLLKHEKEKWKRNTIGLMRGPNKFLAIHRLSLKNLSSQTSSIWRNISTQGKLKQKHYFQRLAKKSAEGKRVLLREIGPRQLRLERGGKSVLKKASETLKWVESAIRRESPQSRLKHGYSLTKVVQKSDLSKFAKFDNIQPGDTLETHLMDGIVVSQVVEKISSKGM